MEISDSDQLSPGHVAILQNQEVKNVREIGSLISRLLCSTITKQELKSEPLYRRKQWKKLTEAWQ